MVIYNFTMLDERSIQMLKSLPQVMLIVTPLHYVLLLFNLRAGKQHFTVWRLISASLLMVATALTTAIIAVQYIPDESAITWIGSRLLLTISMLLPSSVIGTLFFRGRSLRYALAGNALFWLFILLSNLLMNLMNFLPDQ